MGLEISEIRCVGDEVYLLSYTRIRSTYEDSEISRKTDTSKV